MRSPFALCPNTLARCESPIQGAGAAGIRSVHKPGFQLIKAAAARRDQEPEAASDRARLMAAVNTLNEKFDKRGAPALWWSR